MPTQPDNSPFDRFEPAVRPMSCSDSCSDFTYSAYSNRLPTTPHSNARSEASLGGPFAYQAPPVVGLIVTRPTTTLTIECPHNISHMSTVPAEDLSYMASWDAHTHNSGARPFDPTPWAYHAHIEQHDEDMGSAMDSEMEY